MSFPVLVTLIVSWIGIAGDVLVRASARDGKSPNWVIAGGLLYFVTAPGWYYVLKHLKATVAIGCIYPVTQSLTILVVGYCLGERLNTREQLAMVLALSAGLLAVNPE
jgi:hypothetical protein